MSTRSFLSEDLARSDRPPTYTSNTGDSDTASVIDPHARVRSWRGSMLSSPPLLIPDEQQSQYGTDMDSVASSPLPREIYYRVYTPDGAVESKHSFYVHDTSLGRINALWVAPPHNAASIKRHICKEEQIHDKFSTSLFSSTSSASPMDDSTPVLISTGDGPGSSPGEPLALVIDPGTTFPEPEPPKKKQKTNVRKHSLTTPAWLPFGGSVKVKNPKPQESSSPPNEPQPDIPKLFETKIKAKFDVKISDPSWLSHRKGEILYTDGIQRYSGPGDEMKVLLAQNVSGKVGYVYINDMTAA